MINLSTAFKDALANDNRNYLCYADITLLDGTVLNLTNSEIWDGGFSIEDAVSDDNEFQFGTAIIGSATLVINNIYDTYSEYDFDRANVVLWVGLELNGTVEKIRKGTYIVDEPEYNGVTISLGLLDLMSRFDMPYTTSNLTYPATLAQIVADACSMCDVNNNALSFNHSDYVINTRPTDDKLTYRDIICACAQIACMNARVNRDGYLEFIWYDFSTLGNITSDSLDGGTFLFTDGDTADGGNFSFNELTNYDGGSFVSRATYHSITSTYSLSVSTDDVIVTGVSLEYEVDGEEAGTENQIITIGTDGYMLSAKENPFVDASNAQTIANYMGDALIGIRFRKAEVSHPSDPSFEAGDVMTVIDRKGHQYACIVSRTDFKVGDKQDTVSAAATPSKNSATRYSQETKNYVKLREQIINERTDRELATDTINEYLQLEAPGLYFTESQDDETGESVYNWHNKPSLAESDIIWRLTQNAFGVTANGGRTWNFGATSYGDLITRVIQTVGINADWINAGSVTMGISRFNSLGFNLGTALVYDAETDSLVINADSLRIGGEDVATDADVETIANNKSIISGRSVDIDTYEVNTVPTLKNDPAKDWFEYDAVQNSGFVITNSLVCGRNTYASHEGEVAYYRTTDTHYIFELDADTSTYHWRALTFEEYVQLSGGGYSAIKVFDNYLLLQSNIEGNTVFMKIGRESASDEFGVTVSPGMLFCC